MHRNCSVCGAFMQRVRQEYPDEGLCEVYWGCIACSNKWGDADAEI